MHTITAQEVARNKLVSDNLKIVDKVVNTLRRRWPTQLLMIGGDDEARQLGYLGLLEAAEHYDPDHLPHAEFQTFAWRYVQGAILLKAFDAGVIHVPRVPRHPEDADRARQTGTLKPNDDVAATAEPEPVDFGPLHRAIEQLSEEDRRRLTWWSEGVILAEIEPGVTKGIMSNWIRRIIRVVRKRMEGH